ncbi:MAG: TonB-dependent receptor [Tannerella sp.]|jgi:TonB-linked SusC/RagA family outer membrane protein|nr:TonB-dependent receptor [Tannerella sp.]
MKNKQKIVRIMRLTCILLFLSVSIVFASESYAQNTFLSLKISGKTVAEVLKTIEEETDLHFFYNSKLVNTNRSVSVDVKNKDVFAVLNQLFDGQNVAYQVVDKDIILTIGSVDGISQSKVTITGIVIDGTGEPIIGANVIEKGTANGNITDIDGKFSLEVSPGAILQVSYIGYTTKEVAVGNQRTLTISIAEDTQALEEVVVVGYGTQKRSDVTTAVATVSAENMKDRAAANFGEAIAGQVPGVFIQQVNGAPGDEGLKIKIRGTGSITQSNDPLYVIDGYPMEGNALSLLNPSDIESLQILKDASSTAIYGSRGANGVVIITTKKGKSGKPVVRMNAFVGVQSREKEVEMMNRDQYVEWFMDGRNEAWLDAAVIASDPNQSPHTINDSNDRRALYPSATTQYMIPDGTDGYKYNFYDPASVAQMEDNNWQDLLFRDAFMHQYELSVMGGSENTQYTFSGSYTGRQGIVINTDFERFNFRTSVNSKIKERINVGMSLIAYTSNGREQANGKDAPIMYALNLPPIYPEMNPDGSYGSMVRNPEILAGDVASPIGIAKEVYDKRRRYGWLGTVYAEIEFIKNLKYRISVNGGITDNTRKNYRGSYIDFDASKAPRPAEGSNERWNDSDWVIENTLSYNTVLADKHSLSALLGYTTQAHYWERMRGEARTFANDNIYTLNAGTMYSLTSEESEYSMISYLGRLNYVYDDRYLFTATLRRDGSSRFGKNRKWGTFPSASIGWRISEEGFMENVEKISDLKLRASFGISGNNRIGNYSSIALLGTGFYATGDALQNTVNPSTMPNYDLGWEKTSQYNVGFEIGIIDNRIRLEADFYDSQSLDLLLNVPVPTITGYSNQMQNVGKVQNRGMEYMINTRNLVGEFKWSSNFNISFNKNKVIEVGVDDRPIYGSAANANNAFITMPGQPIASFYGYDYQGVFMSQEELDKYPHLAGDKVGDGRYRDVNEDGKLDQNDKTIVGNNQPIFTAGFSNNFEYKNFTLGLQFTGSYGAETFSFWQRMCGIYHGDRNGIIQQTNRWRSPEEPGDGIHFRPTRTPSGWQRDPSSAWVQDASFIRLRNVTLGYDFDTKQANRLGLNGLRFYVTGTNLFTLTDYIGYDPETSSEGINVDSNMGLSVGGDYLGYPAARSFIFGANIVF